MGEPPARLFPLIKKSHRRPAVQASMGMGNGASFVGSQGVFNAFLRTQIDNTNLTYAALMAFTVYH